MEAQHNQELSDRELWKWLENLKNILKSILRHFAGDQQEIQYKNQNFVWPSNFFPFFISPKTCCGPHSKDVYYAGVLSANH